MYNTKRHIQTYQKLFDKTIKGDSNHMTKEKNDTTANKEIKPEYIKDKSKRFDAIPQAKIYLASAFFNDKDKERVYKAIDALQKNPTVALTHWPFDTQAFGVDIEDPSGLFGTPDWINSTFKNDTLAIGTATCGVFLVDLDNVDPGTIFEEAMMYSLHKPTIILPFSDKKPEDVEVNLMIVGGATKWLSGFDELETYDFNHFPSDTRCPYKVY